MLDAIIRLLTSLGFIKKPKVYVITVPKNKNIVV